MAGSMDTGPRQSSTLIRAVARIVPRDARDAWQKQWLSEVWHAYFELLRDGIEPGEAELGSWCKDRLANFKVPKRFHPRQSLPMLPVGKIDKIALRKEAGLT